MRGRMPKQRDQHPIGWMPFEQLADRYDAWFETDRGNHVFEIEVNCIRELLKGMPRPWLEVGVGTGRFAAALDMDEGIDPSSAVLKYAAERGIQTRVGKAEQLPYPDHRFGITLLVVTICFLQDPARALYECRRVLKEDGHMILGLVPKDSQWGKLYAQKGAAGHPFYSVARFYTTKQIIQLAEDAGFYFDRATSCLFEPPDQDVETHKSLHDGIEENAGFVTMRFSVNRKHGGINANIRV
ncbi:MAG: methyltransferase domain-containing protein [Lentisphaerae bacterium]|nr:methyltransferase domain-containing protein [Lentisphaerota bacterium]